MTSEKRYWIMGFGSGLYVVNAQGEKVYRGYSYADCRNKLYELQGWAKPVKWKF